MVPVPVIVPVVVDVSVSVDPAMAALIANDPAAPEAISANVPVAVIGLFIVDVAAVAESVTLTLTPFETPLPVSACVSVRVTLPDVVNVTLGVVIVSEPMFPETLLKVSEIDPVTVPEPLIEPEPVAAKLSVVPETLALIRIPLFMPVVSKVSVPVAVSVLVSVIAFAALA
jgi:hypothetical protein